MNELESINNELNTLQGILDYEVKIIDETTRFWMVRTQKGYFYNEFITYGFIALAWNIIDSSTSFSSINIEHLKDHILLKYSEIKRPTTVINKCRSFINDIKIGDYIVIPNAGSELITIALAGEYFEEKSKTYEIEREVISRIEKGDVIINDVSCPYKKRRKIIPLITVKSMAIDGKLYKAISNYHGISNLDDYWRNILGELYNSYCYRDNLSIIYHVKRKKPVGPRMLAALLSKSFDCWCYLFDEDNISVQVNIASPGPVDFSIVNVLPDIWQGVKILAGITIGTLSVLKPEAIPTFIKNLFSLPSEINREYIALKREKIQKDKEEATFSFEVEEKRLELIEKKLDILEKLKDIGVDPEKVSASATALVDTFSYLQIENVTPSVTMLPTVNQVQDNDELLEEDIAEEEQ